MTGMERYFERFRNNIVGYDQTFVSPYGQQRIVYADWTASGRLYRPIEETLLNAFGPFVGNTHSESSVTGTSMTRAYHEAHNVIKRHVNAGPDDLILTPGNGMTAAVNKFQRILGLKAPERLRRYIIMPEEERPVVFVSHMEHYSNHTSWLETIADVVVILPNKEGLVDLDAFGDLLDKFHSRRVKIGAFIACSNVTGVFAPYQAMAKLMHKHGGVCFVDFAASAPYERIDCILTNLLRGLTQYSFLPTNFSVDRRRRVY